ncbi:MAG: NTP transferase domain-containing protein [Dehalococcoidia bacterium]|nr:NTP transferase domain-containing protein [Dehalococcoidia bacterium]
MAEKNAGAIIVAAGNSARMDGEDKMLTLLGGKPLIAYTVAAFEKCEAISAIVLVVNENNREAIATMSGEMGWRKTMPLVLGGARQRPPVGVRVGRRPRRRAPVRNAGNHRAWPGGGRGDGGSVRGHPSVHL